MSILKQIVGLLVSLVLAFGMAALGKFFTNLSVDAWYPTLVKPAWTPTGTFIGAVWTVLYTAMGIASWLVWRRGEACNVRYPLAIYALQLILNAAWSALFFGLRSPGLALVGIVVLWFAIAATLKSFWKFSKLAGALIIPYLMWVSFAGVLNAIIWRLN